MCGVVLALAQGSASRFTLVQQFHTLLILPSWDVVEEMGKRRVERHRAELLVLFVVGLAMQAVSARQCVEVKGVQKLQNLRPKLHRTYIVPVS